MSISRWLSWPKQCEHCNTQLASVDDSTRHFESKHYCATCQLPYPSLSRHEGGKYLRVIAQLEQVYRCCTTLYESSQELQDHVRSNPEAHPRTCLSCRLEFESTTDLKCHKLRCHKFQTDILAPPRTHDLTTPIIHPYCKFCDRIYLNEEDQKAGHKSRTVIVHYFGTVKPWVCLICSRRFVDSMAIHQHIRSHSAHNATCNVCGLDFMFPSITACHKRSVHVLADEFYPLTFRSVHPGSLLQPGLRSFEDDMDPLSYDVSDAGSNEAQEPSEGEAISQLTRIISQAFTDIARLEERLDGLAIREGSPATPLNPRERSLNSSSGPSRPEGGARQGASAPGMQANRGTDLMCPICMDTCTNHTVTACGHLFCNSCILGWMEEGGDRRCPACQSRVVAGGLRRIYL